MIQKDKNSYIITVFQILLLICNQKVLTEENVLLTSCILVVLSQRENKGLYDILLESSVIFDTVKTKRRKIGVIATLAHYCY